MKPNISSDMMSRLLDASVGSIFRLYIERTVSRRFKSIRYLTSERLVDCIVLDILLNDNISPHSGDEATAFVQSKSRSFYASVEREFSFIKEDFMNYAATVVDNIEEIIALDMRAANFIVYILAKDASNSSPLNRDEIFLRAFNYSELSELDIPHF